MGREMNRMFTHDLVTAVCAPAAVLSDRDGQLRGQGAQGWLVADVRHLSELTVLVGGEPADPVGHWPESAAALRFVGAVIGLGDGTGDPTVRLERRRVVDADTLRETIELVNDARAAVEVTVTVRLAADLAPILAFRYGRPTSPVPPRADGPTWAAGSCTTTLATDRAPDRTEHAADHVLLSWDLRVPPRDRTAIGLTLTASSATDDAVVRPPLTRDLGPLAVESREPELDRLVATGLDDLRALLLADPAAPADRFAGAGTPWYFTLFGRDSLWAARFALPLGTDLALGTLRALARRQGTREDPETAEAPGKILHEIRQLPAGIERAPGLPPCYYGTIDATPLWISLLHDAWRWGAPASAVEPLLEPMRRALDWLLRHEFLSYVDESGRGLANQGWKDSADSVQDGTGRIARPPIVLSEAQAYAHRAALDAAALLDAFGRPGAGAGARVGGGAGGPLPDVVLGRRFPGAGAGRRGPPGGHGGVEPGAPAGHRPAVGGGGSDGGDAAGVAGQRLRPAHDGRFPPVLQPDRLPHGLGVATRHGDRDRRPDARRPPGGGGGAGDGPGARGHPLLPPPARAVRRLGGRVAGLPGGVPPAGVVGGVGDRSGDRGPRPVGERPGGPSHGPPRPRRSRRGSPCA